MLKSCSQDDMGQKIELIKSCYEVNVCNDSFRAIIVSQLVKI